MQSGLLRDLVEDHAHGITDVIAPVVRPGSWEPRFQSEGVESRLQVALGGYQLRERAIAGELPEERLVAATTE